MRLAIAMAADFNYVDKVETLVKSIIFHNSSCNLYLLNQDFPQEWFLVMNKRLEKSDSSIKDIKIDNQIVHHYKTLEHINYAAYLRYFIPDYITEEKILYLDTDIIITGQLNQLFETILDDNTPLAAVRDVWLKQQFNSGVMLINNHYWKKENITEQLLTTTEKFNQGTTNGDQEILNIVFKQNWLELPLDCNAQIGMNIVLQPAGLPTVPYHPLPLVVHYASDQKPWIFHLNSAITMNFTSSYFFIFRRSMSRHFSDSFTTISILSTQVLQEFSRHS